MYRAVSLFSGAGGLDIGFESHGFSVVYAVEQNIDSAMTWKVNRPSNAKAMHVSDINDCLDEIAQLSDIDIVFGGPPCQGFSIAGKMRPDDPRNKLIHTFLEVVELTRPKVFVMENVRALASSPRWKKVREDILHTCELLQYGCSLEVYNAKDYGVSENRERMLLVGVREDTGLKANIFHEAMLKQKRMAAPVREVIKRVGKYGSSSNPVTGSARITLAKKPVIRATAYSGMLVNGSGRPINLDTISPTLTASMGGNKTPIIDQRSLEDKTIPNWFVHAHDIWQKNESFNGLTVPKYVRRLTVTEAAAIQGFPKEYIFHGSVCSQYRQIGNAVPCGLSSVAAQAVVDSFFDLDK
ncbi:DNA cytosine methyltransferase [Alloscardovia venturai]